MSLHCLQKPIIIACGSERVKKGTKVWFSRNILRVRIQPKSIMEACGIVIRLLSCPNSNKCSYVFSSRKIESPVILASD